MPPEYAVVGWPMAGTPFRGCVGHAMVTTLSGSEPPQTAAMMSSTMTTAVHALTLGDPAPDLALADGSGTPVQLSTLWMARPLLLVFLRHYG